jgi:hypothetical protein
MLLSSGIPKTTIHTEEPDEALSRIAPKSSVLKVWCHSIREGWDGTGLVTVQIHVPSGTKSCSFMPHWSNENDITNLFLNEWIAVI